MIRYENLLIPISLIFCLYASYTDLRYRKIRNLCSFGLIYSGLIFQILFVIQGKIAMLSMISILLGAIAISFLLYWFNIFAAGDSKLFLGTSLALPPALFQEVTGRILFPPIVLAINTFAPYFLGMTIYLLVKSSTLQKKEALSAILDRKVLPILLVNYLGFFSLAVIVAAIWNKIHFFRLLHLNNFFRMAFILATFIALRKYTTKSKNGRLIFALFIPVAGILMLLSPPSLGNLFKSLLLYFVVYILATPFLMNLVLPLFSKEIKISEIQEGIIPAETIVEIQNDFGSSRYLKLTSLNQIQNSNEKLNGKSTIIVSPTLRGLEGEQVKVLKKLADEGHFSSFGNSIRVQQPMCFAPVILAGVLITILAKGPFYFKLPPLINLVSRWVG